MVQLYLGTTPEGRKIYVVDFTGPESYAEAGFTVTVGGLQKIEAIMGIQRTSFYQPDDNVVQDEWTFATNVLTCKLNEVDVTAASATSWATVAAMTDVSDFTGKITVIGQ